MKGLNRKLDTARERIADLENTSEEIHKTITQGKKKKIY